MALGVYDVTKKPAGRIAGSRVAKVVRLTLDTDYAAGGYALTAATLGLSAIHVVLANPTGGFILEYDYTNSKMKVLTGDNDAGADGPLVEVADGLNAIDTLTARVLVIGEAA